MTQDEYKIYLRAAKSELMSKYNDLFDRYISEEEVVLGTQIQDAYIRTLDGLETIKCHMWNFANSPLSP